MRARLAATPVAGERGPRAEFQGGNVVASKRRARWSARGVGALFAGALVLPLGVSGALADTADAANVTVPADQVGVQLYSLIPWVEDVGLEAVFQRLQEVGIQNIEPYGGNFSDLTAEEFKALADKYDLNVSSSHYNVDEDTFDTTLEYVKTIGQEYVGSGGFPDPGIDTYANTLATAEAMNRLGKRSVEAGTGKFFGHNHTSELLKTYEHNGEDLMAWEILVAETDPKYVTFEVDVAWAAHANVDVPALLRKYSDRVELLHIKDGDGLGTADRPTFTNLGDGENKLQEILAAAADGNIEYYIMEYDRAADGNSFVTNGFEYLTGITPPYIPATTEDVTFSDADATYLVPSVQGVEYVLDGQVLEPGYYAGKGDVTITARTLDGYTLTEGSAAAWSHTFTLDSADRVTVPADKVGVQLFSLIPWVGEDGLEPVLGTLADIGIKNIEPFGGNFSDYTAEEFRAMTDELGLHVPSSHYNTDEDTFDETLEYVKTVGQEYVGSGGFAAPGVDTYENTLATAATMDRLGKRSVDAGVGKFFGHNHAGEMLTKYVHEGELLSAWEILVRETNPEYVTFEVDVAWATHGRMDVPALLREYGDRVSMLHIKDGDGLGIADRPSFTNLGDGDNNLQAILAAAQDTAVEYYIMEYDVAADGESFVTEGYEYLTGLDAYAPTAVTPAEVTFSDDDATFTIPASEGVEYLVDGTVVEAGVHAGEGSVTVTARALEGFVLADGATAEWTHTFTAPDTDGGDQDTSGESGESGESGASDDAAAGDGGSGSLPETGSDVGGVAAASALLLLVGAAILVTRRRQLGVNAG
ncbi:TIM barrel protein [Pseudactinotalea sp. HY160]|nr:TIM barrel protein [Pseudactinotalea sp. HY160]